MPNANRPDDTRCPADSLATECSTVDSTTPGVCRYCDLGTCSLCGAPMTPAQCVESKRQAPDTIGDERYCPVCLPVVVADAADTGGVPEAVEEAQTVRLPREPIGAAGLGEVLAERGREIAAGRGKLSAAVA